MKSRTIKELEAHREYMQTSRSKHSENVCHRYKDCYQILGIERNATHSEIKHAYRNIALLYHPDRNASAEAAERWEGVPAAYAIISDPNRRAKYDSSLPTRDALVEFYKAYNPSKLDIPTIDSIIEGWLGREVELFEMLNIKYEVESHKGKSKLPQLDLQNNLSAETARKIALDSVTNDPLVQVGSPAKPVNSSIRNVFCCGHSLQRLICGTYFEVEMFSPGVLAGRSHSETPGQSGGSESTNVAGGKEKHSLTEECNLTCSTTDDDLDSISSELGDEDLHATTRCD